MVINIENIHRRIHIMNIHKFAIAGNRNFKSKHLIFLNLAQCDPIAMYVTGMPLNCFKIFAKFQPVYFITLCLTTGVNGKTTLPGMAINNYKYELHVQKSVVIQRSI